MSALKFQFGLAQVADEQVVESELEGGGGRLLFERGPTAILGPMLTYLRYALATCCFAASVGCLALWGWNVARRDMLDGAGLVVASTEFEVEVYQGIAAVWASTTTPNVTKWQVKSVRLRNDARFAGILRQRGRFGAIGPAIFFPLWYPALVFALAGVATLRLGRRFTLRSALIATTVVAGLLGMAVGM